MNQDYNNMLKAEILFNKVIHSDKSHILYNLALKEIMIMLMTGASIKEVKREIKKLGFEKEIKRAMEKIAQEQHEIITKKDDKINLSLIFFLGYSFKELIRKRIETIHNDLYRFVVNAETFIKDRSYTKSEKRKEIFKILKERRNKYIQGSKDNLSFVSKISREFSYTIDSDRNIDNIKGWISIAVLDNRTSPLCLGLHNKTYYKSEGYRRSTIPNPPPRHNRCRSIISTVYNDQKFSNVRKQNANTFLKENPTFGKEILGDKKYDLYLKSRKSFINFVDLDNNRFYTNDEIKDLLN